MDYEDLQFAVTSHVARITINRPEKLNAFRQKTLDELIDAFKICEADAYIGVIVLTGGV